MNNGTLMVSVADKTFGIRFGIQAIVGCRAEGAFDEISATSEGQKAFMTAAQISKMAWHGYLNWCLFVDERTELTRQEFFELLDVACLEDPNLFQSIVNTFTESKLLNKTQEAEKKRKATMK